MGIWACNSLLHISQEQLPDIILKFTNSLKYNGCFYISFKYGDFNGIKNGRYFQNMTEKSFENIIKDIQCLKIIKTKINTSNKVGQESEKILNIFLRKEK